MEIYKRDIVALAEKLIPHTLVKTPLGRARLLKKYPYMAQCDVYVQTSSFEGYGLTIAEAKILGKPVVSTNFDVVHDQIKHEHDGLIAEMTPESVADNILRLINEKDLRNRIIACVNKEKNTTYMTEVEKVEKLFDAN